MPTHRETLPRPSATCYVAHLDAAPVTVPHEPAAPHRHLCVRCGRTLERRR